MTLFQLTPEQRAAHIKKFAHTLNVDFSNDDFFTKWPKIVQTIQAVAACDADRIPPIVLERGEGKTIAATIVALWWLSFVPGDHDIYWVYGRQFDFRNLLKLIKNTDFEHAYTAQIRHKTSGSRLHFVDLKEPLRDGLNKGIVIVDDLPLIFRPQPKEKDIQKRIYALLEAVNDSNPAHLWTESPNEHG